MNREEKGKIVNLPNIVTLLRLIGIPFLAMALFENRILAIMLLVLIVIGDGIDGYLARKFKQRTDFGKAFDGIVDGLLIAVILIALYSNKEMSLFWMVLLLFPKVFIFLLEIVYTRIKGEVVAVKTIFGKVSTIFLYLVFGFLILGYFNVYVLVVAAVLVYVSVGIHTWKVIKENKR